MKVSPVFGVQYPEASDHTRLWEYFETITTGLEAPFGASAWSTWNPGWSSNAGAGDVALAIGNGSSVARFRKIGDEYEAEYLLTRGTTTNLGNGYYSWNLPAGPWNFRAVYGMGICTSPSLVRTFALRGTGGTRVTAHQSTGDYIGSSNPGSWADGGIIYWRARMITTGA